jgi:SAM-dependent methyltransferase
MTSTLDHYNRTAQRYVEVNHELLSVQPELTSFLALLRGQPGYRSGKPLRILDAGSGSGRDTLAFLDQGCLVDAFDGSAAMAEISSRLTAQKTRVMRFEELDLQTDSYG